MKVDFVEINEEVVDQLNKDLQNLYDSLSKLKNSTIRKLIPPDQLEKTFSGIDSLMENMYTNDDALLRLSIVKIIFEGRCRISSQKQLHANMRKYYPEFINDCINQYSTVTKNEDGWLKYKCFFYGIWVGSTIRFINLVHDSKKLCDGTDFEDVHVVVNLNGEWYTKEMMLDNKNIFFTKGYDPYNKEIYIGKLFGKYVVPSYRCMDYIDSGYYELFNIADKGDCLIVDTRKVPYDYYKGITPQEFLDVLEYNEFKVGFIDEYEVHDNIEYQIFAYHLPTRMVINALTFGGKFDRAEVYCPGKICNIVDSLIYEQINSMTVFNITHYESFSSDNEGIIHILKKYMEKSTAECTNFYKEPILLWNYSDYSSTIEDFVKIRKRIKKADHDDMLKLFDHCDEMLEVLNN